jgi:hypothetical protein
MTERTETAMTDYPRLYRQAIQLGPFPKNPSADEVAAVMRLVTELRGGDWHAVKFSGFWMVVDKASGHRWGGVAGQRTRDFPAMLARGCGVAVVLDLPTP